MGCLSLLVMVTGRQEHRPTVDARLGLHCCAAVMWSTGWLRVAGLLEVVGQRAGLAREQLGPCVVAGGGRVPVVDLQRDVPLAERDVLRLQGEPALLLGEQLDLLARRRR